MTATQRILVTHTCAGISVEHYDWVPTKVNDQWIIDCIEFDLEITFCPYCGVKLS